jgi:hypothetical protein
MGSGATIAGVVSVNIAVQRGAVAKSSHSKRAQRSFSSICFDRTGPRGAPFSAAWDVLPFCGLNHFTQTTNRLPGHLKQITDAAIRLLRE